MSGAVKVLRYAAVSVVATALSLTVLGALVFSGILGAAWANVTATAAGTIPSFELNRRWVWRQTDRRSVRHEIGPFAVMSFTGLALSTVAVSAAAEWAGHAGLSAMGKTLVVAGANLSAFGTLWVVQFAVLDRVLFRRRGLPPPALALAEADRGDERELHAA